MVYNGTRKIAGTETNFMTAENIVKAVKLIKMKNSEGDDRIPQRILIDGLSVMVGPLSHLFNLCNRLTVLNGLIKLDWLNLSLTAFKLKAKEILLNN